MGRRPSTAVAVGPEVERAKRVGGVDPTVDGLLPAAVRRGNGINWTMNGVGRLVPRVGGVDRADLRAPGGGIRCTPSSMRSTLITTARLTPSKSDEPVSP